MRNEILIACLAAAMIVGAARGARAADKAADLVRLKDITSVEGVRGNPLIGYGVVVGLAGTGDSRQTVFTTQTLGNILQRMGVQIPATAVQVRNVAAVFITATLPPFAQPGTRIDVTVSSTGDAKSLGGGMLLLAPLVGADGKVYAMAQGPLDLGGYSAGLNSNAKVVNHPNVGIVPNGAIVERDTAVSLAGLTQLSLLLRNPDFTTARNVADAINKALGRPAAMPLDSRRIVISGIPRRASEVSDLLANIEDLRVPVDQTARVVVNERTGTVVMGGNVTLGAAAILHGNLTVQIVTHFEVSQPEPFTKGGKTVVVPQTNVQAQDQAAQSIKLQEGATVEELVRGLQTIGASPRDVIAILQALKAAGALHAQLVVT
jgi:flagellar P-ring protein precursor FlgI